VPQIHRRDLEKPQAVHLLAERWQAIGQEASVPAAHSLNADARATERGLVQPLVGGVADTVTCFWVVGVAPTR